MTVVISLLRGINIAGHHRIQMPALKSLYESLGLLSVQSHIQSGNIVFRTKARDFDSLAERIAEGIQRTFGFRPAVILRTCAELRAVVVRNPFAARPDLDPSKLAVMFLARGPDKEAREKLGKMKTGPEEFFLQARELYVYFPNGIGRSVLPATAERTLRTPVTGRNWNTVTRLLDIAQTLEESR